MSATIVLSAPMNDGADVGIEVRPGPGSIRTGRRLANAVHEGLSLVSGPLPKDGLMVVIHIHRRSGPIASSDVRRTVASLFQEAISEEAT